MIGHRQGLVLGAALLLLGLAAHEVVACEIEGWMTAEPICTFCQDHPESCNICGQYCPPHLAYPKKCEAGNYCPHLGLSKVCPEGHYCRQGSFVPSPCQPLVVCEEGTPSETKGFAGLLFNFLLALMGYVMFQLYKYCRNKRREERAMTWNSNPISGSASESKSEVEEAKPGFTPFLIDLGFKHLFYFIRQGERRTPVLNNVSGQFLHGRLIAIMGPSGAGKTTLLRVLSGRLSVNSSKVKGSILVNGVESSIMKYRSLVGYVPQDDVMLSNLTVKENIRYSALTRLPRDWTRKQKMARARDVVRLLELEGVRHSKVGNAGKRGISGGQRKRVNIGMELVANPSILFLDEPTSGLDSSGARHVMKLLHKLAAIGMTVVCVVHQPRWEIFRLFHDVTLLSTGGYLTYFGPVREAVGYFTGVGYQPPGPRMNPADYLIDIVSGDLPGPGDRFLTNDSRRYSLDERFISDEVVASVDDLLSSRPSLAEGDEEEAEETKAPSGPRRNHPAADRRRGTGAGRGAGAGSKSADAATNFGPPNYGRRDKDKGKYFYELLPRLWLERVRRQRRAARAKAAAKGPPESASAKSRASSAKPPKGRRTSVLRRASRVFQRSPVTADKTEDDSEVAASTAAAETAVTKELREERRMAGWFEQFLMFMLRSFNQQLVMITHLATDLFLVCCAGAVLGMVYFDPDEQSDLLQTVSLSCLVMGMTAITSSQRWFSKEIEVFHREQYVGCSASAYFLAKVVAHIPLILLSPAVYLTFYYTFSAPRASVSTYYGIFVLIEAVGTGVGYCVPLLFKGRAQLAGVVFPLVCTMFAGVSPDIEELNNMGPLGVVAYTLSYARWGVELLYLANAKAMDPALFKIPDTLDSLNYSYDHELVGVLVLISMAVFFRLVTFILLMRGKHAARRR